ncbi:putative 2OG-Fe(II) oxygenase [Thiolapillus sp.]
MLHHQPEYQTVHIRNHDSLNAGILRDFQACRHAPDRQTHFFHGRYENLYIDIRRMPSVRALLDIATGHAARILGMDPGQLRCGFWFNLMEPGQVTSLHSHDEDDELLSCVYYVDVPASSGELVLLLEDGEKRLKPENGMFVFFPPWLEHEVSRHEGGRSRLSLAINFGPAAV